MIEYSCKCGKTRNKLKGYLSKLLKNTNKANYRGMTIKRTNV